MERSLVHRSSELGNPDSWMLGRIEWDVFGTLTWREVPPRSVMQKCVTEFIRRVAKQVYKKSPLDIMWAIRYEEGEKTQRPHYHILIGAYKDGPTNKHTIANQCKHIWENDVKKRLKSNAYRPCVGFADCRPYDSSKAGAEYVCKPALSARDYYELMKFNDGFKYGYNDDACTVSLGPRLVLELAKMRSKTHKVRGFARFLREWKQRNVGAKRTAKKTKTKYQVMPSNPYPHPMDDAVTVTKKGKFNGKAHVSRNERQRLVHLSRLRVL